MAEDSTGISLAMFTVAYLTWMPKQTLIVELRHTMEVVIQVVLKMESIMEGECSSGQMEINTKESLIMA